MKWQLVFSTRIIITQHPSTPSAARKAPRKQVETIVMFTWTAFFPFRFLISINIGQAGIQSGNCAFFRMGESDEMAVGVFHPHHHHPKSFLTKRRTQGSPQTT